MTDIPLTIGLVAHHAFCPRRAWLEAHGERTDTAQMAVGVVDHEAVDDSATSRPARLRAVDVASERLGVVGRCDSVERNPETGALTVVEHKANPVRRRSQVTDAQTVQLALQVLCLRESGQEVEGAAVWFSTTRTRVPLEITPDLLDAARELTAATRRSLSRSRPPAPLDDDRRCQSCSHVSVCLPDEHRSRGPARRISVDDPIGKVLHLTTPGSRAGLRRGQVEVSARDVETVRIPFGHVSALVVHGNADVSSALVREMLWHRLPIVWCTWSGRVSGWAASADSPNGELRGPQHRMADTTRLAVARALVSGKIRNQRYMMRRHSLDGRDEMARAARAALAARSVGELFGIEGSAAKTYFEGFGKAIKTGWEFEGRLRRPARDRINAALNLAYGLLLSDVVRAVAACGLDPAGGAFHSSGRNKPALALDLMEEFRPLIADSAALWAINNGEVRSSHFRTDVDAVRLTAPGRKSLIAAYERRVTSEFVHPTFRYRVTWRRAMEVQARLFMAVVTGERALYEPVVLR